MRVEEDSSGRVFVFGACARCREEKDIEEWRNGFFFCEDCRITIEEEEADARLDHFGRDEIGGLRG